MHREVKQTAPDGATRSFYFFNDTNGDPWLTIKERNRAGETTSSTDIHFPDNDLQKFIAAAQAVA